MPTRLADGHGGLHVALEEETLDANPMRSVHAEQLGQGCMQGMQPFRVRGGPVGSHHSGIDEPQLPAP